MSSSSGFGPCGSCGKKANLRCVKCRFVYYCDQNCQKKNSKQHKTSCLSLEPNVKKTEIANSILLEILDQVKLNKVETGNTRKIIKGFIEDILIKDMRKSNKLFDKIYSRIFHTGSFYDDTKIENPNEFDLNIVLDLKSLDIPYEIVRLEDCPPGHIMIQVDPPSTSTTFENLKDGQDRYNFFEKFQGKYFVVPKNIKEWFKWLLNDISITNLFRGTGFPEDVQQIQTDQCGPATTLNIHMRSGIEIDVDIVPVFSFGQQLLNIYPEVWKNIHDPDWLKPHPEEYRNQVLTALEKDFFAVPKPYIELPKDLPRLQEINIFELTWRLDFHEAETEIIKNKTCATNVIKLLKYFRNCNPPLHEFLKSYILKTLIMSIIWQWPRISWSDYDLCNNFLAALRGLCQICMGIASGLEEHQGGNFVTPTIIYLFDRNINLLPIPESGNLANLNDARAAFYINLMISSKDVFENISIKELWNNKDNKEFWMKHFQVQDTEPYFENLPMSKKYGEIMTKVMKKHNTSDPNKEFLRYNANCEGVNCKAITAIILEEQEQLKKSPAFVTIQERLVGGGSGGSTDPPLFEMEKGEMMKFLRDLTGQIPTRAQPEPEIVMSDRTATKIIMSDKTTTQFFNIRRE